MMTRHSIGRSIPLGAIVVFSVLACDDSKTVGTVQNAGGTNTLAGTGDTGGAPAGGATQASGGANAGAPSTNGIGGVATGGAPSSGGTGDGTVGNVGAAPGTGGTAVDAGCEADAGGLLPAPVLDPTGTYGGKTLGEWGAAYWKWLLELPGSDSPLIDSTGALCALGQSDGQDAGAAADPVFFLADVWGPQPGTRSCTIPAGKMIFIPFYNDFWDNGGVPADSQLTDTQLKDCLAKADAAVDQLSLEIDGKSYGSRVCDYANYFNVWTQFSYTVPNTPTNFYARFLSSKFSGPVPVSFSSGYWILLAPLSAGSHSIHVKKHQVATPACGTTPGGSGFSMDFTYNLTVE